MRVTKIVPLSKNRSKVYIEQEFAFVLYRGELRSYRISEGEEIAQEDYRSIVEELLPKRAKLRAMNLLKTREYTVSQLKNKLQEGFYPEQVIEEAVEYMVSCRYVDDLRYATDFITGHENSRSRRRIEQDLQNRGIDKSTLKRAWTLWEEQGGRLDEQEMIRHLLEKKHYDAETADLKEQQRIYGFLTRKGFSGEQIRKAIRACHIAEI